MPTDIEINCITHEIYPLEALRLDGGTQSRVAIDESVVQDYAEAIKNGAKLPEVTVFADGDDLWLADGFHRFHAYRSAGQTTIACEVHSGTQREAILYSVGANARHGLRRTNEDKRQAVTTLLKDDEWVQLPDVAIAKACGVSSNFVGEMRRIIHPINDSPTRIVQRNGKSYQQNTAKIGRTKRHDQGKPLKEPANTDPLPHSERAPTAGKVALNEGGHVLAVAEEAPVHTEDDTLGLSEAVDPMDDVGAPTDLQAQVSQLTSENAALLARLNAAHQALQEYQAKHVELEQQNAELTGKYAALETKYGGLLQENREYAERLGED